ncbi:MAG TPA: hypothetical protein PKM67_05235 [Kiritimatiellia bacterium]|nr:hypothetical protein [Kiritimatiellia bacterium]
MNNSQAIRATQKTSFKTPIISSIFNIMGYIVATTGLLMTVYIIASSVSGKNDSGMAGAGIPLAFAALVSLPFFGLAQVVTFIGRTAFYTEAINDELIVFMRDIYKTTNQISERLNKMIAREISRDIKAEAEPVIESGPAVKRGQSIECPLCGADIPICNIREGMNRCPDCQQEFEVE